METGRLFGRDLEIRELRIRLQGEPGLILLRGEAGVGKTRLVQESLTAVGDGRAVVWGRPEQVTRPGPYALILDLIEDVIHRMERPAMVDSLKLAGERLASPEIDSEVDLPLRRLGAEIRGALIELSPRPIAILEDLHQADEASLAVVLMLVRSARDDGYTLVGTYREEEVEGNAGLERLLDVVTRERLSFDIELGSLDRDSGRALAIELLGSAVAGDETIERLLDLGEGIPFYLEELAEAHRIGSTALPKTVSRSASVRLQRLGPQAKLVIQAAALLAGPVDQDILAAALDLDSSTIERSLVHGLHIGLFREHEGRLVFRHALIREALVEDLSAVERRTIHQQLATSIEELFPEDIDSQALSLALHWYGARNRPKALQYGLLAGQHALTLAAMADARRAFELALASYPESTPAPSVLIGLAEVSRREGDLEEAAALFERASQGFQIEGRNEPAAQAIADAAWMRWLANRDPSVIDAIDKALRMAKDDRGSLRATLLTRKGKALAGLGRTSEVQSVLTTALEAAQGSRDDATQANVLEALAIYLADFHNDMTAYHEYSLAACQKALASGNAELIGRTHNNRALTLILREDVSTGLSCLEVARERLESSFGASGLAIIHVTEAMARWRLGQPMLVEQALARSALSFALFRGWVRILRAWSSVHANDQEQAQRIADSGWIEVGQSPADVARGIRSEAVAETALCALLLATESQRSDDVLVFDAITEYYGDRHEGLLGASLGARSAVIARQFRHAHQLAERADELLNLIPSPYLRAHATETKGWVAESRGEVEEALQLYLTAKESFSEFGNLVDAGRCLRLAAQSRFRLAGRSEDFAPIVAELREALQIVSDAGSLLEVSRVEAQMRQLGARPRAGRPRKRPAEGQGNGLSSREEQVAGLVAAGLTNSEIANRLYLSERTVQDHITHALRKLQLPGRAALAAWAVRNRRI